MIRAEYSGRPCLGDPLLPIQLSSSHQKDSRSADTEENHHSRVPARPSLRRPSEASRGFRTFTSRALRGSTSPCASLMVVELAVLTNEEDASLSRDALGNMPFAALLEMTSNAHRFAGNSPNSPRFVPSGTGMVSSSGCMLFCRSTKIAKTKAPGNPALVLGSCVSACTLRLSAKRMSGPGRRYRNSKTFLLQELSARRLSGCQSGHFA